MSDLLTISAKRLGWLAQPDFCPRCFFLKWRLNWHGPWELPMPIYNTLDRAQKACICRIIDETGRAPAWMSEWGEIVGYIEPPSYRKFFFIDHTHHVRVWGNADLIPVLVDGRIKIVDLKTAKARGDNDARRGEHNLLEPRGDRHLAHVADLLEAQLQSHQEQQQDDADLGD